MIKVEGMLEACGKVLFLVDGAAHVNAIVPNLMALVPDRTRIHLNKCISNFDGTIAVDANNAFEFSLHTHIPGLSKGDVNFIEAPVKTHDAILGISWLEKVISDIDWKTKNKEYSKKTLLTMQI